MCLIIFSPDISKSQIDPADLARAFKTNDDGVGFSYIKNGNVITDKVYLKYKKFKKAYERIIDTIQGPLLIHFRLASSGVINRENAHPFTIQRNKLVMAHNGIFSELSFEKSKISDTVRFVNMLKNLNWKYPYNKDQQRLLEIACGNFNKLVFLDNNSDYIIINEGAGVWKNNAWYSNTYSFENKKERGERFVRGEPTNFKEMSNEELAAYEMYEEMKDYARDSHSDFPGAEEESKEETVDERRFRKSVPWHYDRKKLNARRAVMIGARVNDPDFHQHGYGLGD